MSDKIDVELLQRIHSLLRQRANLVERIEKGPRTIKIAETNLAKTSQQRLDLRARRQQTQMKADDKQLQLQEREAHIEKLVDQRNSCESNREYQLLTDQIAADKKANEVLQDEILELLEKLDQLASELRQVDEEVQKLRVEVERIRSRIDADLKVVRADLKQVEQELATTTGKLPGAIKEDFNRLVGQLGEDVLSQVEDDACGHCNNVLNPQTISLLTMSKPVFCNCGSLLYLPRAASAAN